MSDRLIIRSNQPVHPSECPCKLIKSSLSTFTAAEFGEVDVLRQKAEKLMQPYNPLPSLGSSYHGSTDSQETNQPLNEVSDWYSPLHLAAQHGHVAATSFLLEHVSAKVGMGVGALPLHRAAFAGAVGTMRLLLDQHDTSDLLAIDGSCGDGRTPLHKAVGGGRFLAVKLLLVEMQARSNGVPVTAASRSGSVAGSLDPVGKSILSNALSAVDAYGQTPLELARDIATSRSYETERSSVARWDSVAGGRPDWRQCMNLLEDAAVDCQMPAATEAAIEAKPTNAHFPVLPALASSNQDGCSDCTNGVGGKCATASWEAAFRAALTNSIKTAPTSGKTLAEDCDSLLSGNIEIDLPDENRLPSLPLSKAEREHTDVGSLMLPCGRPCFACGKLSISLHPFLDPNGLSDPVLLCRACRRLRSKHCMLS
jgi:Ankyrin repeats (3 copies)